MVAIGSRPMANAKVENAVQLAERWILAKLRNQTFFGLDELNAAIRPLRDALNGKVTRHLGASRRALFETIDKPALKPLPAAPYVYAEWKQRRAGIDYHVEIDRHYYSFDRLTRPRRTSGSPLAKRPRSCLIASADQTDALGACHSADSRCSTGLSPPHWGDGPLRTP